MDEVGLDQSVVFPLGAPYTDYSESNRIIAEEAAKYPGRIIGFSSQPRRRCFLMSKQESSGPWR